MDGNLGLGFLFFLGLRDRPEPDQPGHAARDGKQKNDEDELFPTATPADLSKQLELSLTAARGIGQAAEALRDLRALRRQLAERRQAAESASNGALAAKIAGVDAEAAKLLGGGRGGGSASLSSVAAELNAALGVAQSADRTPPAVAYQIADQAGRALAAQLASWKSLRDTGLAELNRELRQNRMSAIDLAAR